MEYGKVKRGAIVIGAPLIIVGAMLASVPDDGKHTQAPRDKHASQARHALAGAQSKQPSGACTGVCGDATATDKRNAGAWDNVDWRGDGKPNHVQVRGTDHLAEYEKITEDIARDVEAGYSPPPIGEETEGDAQARVLANCRAGFTDEDAPATGSGFMDCAELEAEAAEDSQ